MAGELFDRLDEDSDGKLNYHELRGGLMRSALAK